MLELDLPDNFAIFTEEEQEQIKKYLSELTDIQKQAYKIAKQHLGSSFHILKSNGFIQWIKNQ
jgi:competence protein ComGC